MILAVALFLSLKAFGGGAPFSVGGQAESQDVSELKRQAVLDYLARALGPRFQQYEKAVTPEFAERYILDYKVSRSGGNRVQLTGHLDAEALKGWIRLSETKGGKNAFRPMLLISSSIPGLTISPKETASKVRESALGQQILSEATAAFQKVNAKLTVPDGGPSLSAPPRAEGEIRTLRDVGEGYSCALWVHLSPCKSCGGSRLDLFVYNLGQARRVLGKSEDLALSGGDFNSAPRVKTALKAPFAEFKNDLEEIVSNGQLFSSSYRLVVEGVESYRAYKRLETEIGELDYLNQVVLKRVEPKVAEFEVLSSLGGEEVLSRLDGETFNGFRLKPVRVDSHHLVVKYSR